MIEKFSFTPAEGLRSAASFPDPKSEQETREQLQRLHDQTKNYINDTLVPRIDNDNDEINHLKEEKPTSTGFRFIRLNDDNTLEVSTDGVNWTLVTQQGIQGDMGPQGNPGPKGDPGNTPIINAVKVGSIATITILNNGVPQVITLRDGVDGEGSGDMAKSTYDTNNDGVVDNAEKVNNHTVMADVPEGAKFSDTVYDDTEVREMISTNATVIAELAEEEEGHSTAIASNTDGVNALKIGVGALRDDVNARTEAHSVVLTLSLVDWNAGEQTKTVSDMGNLDLASTVHATIPEDITSEELKNLSGIILKSVSGNNLTFKAINNPKGDTRIKIVSIGG